MKRTIIRLKTAPVAGGDSLKECQKRVYSTENESDWGFAPLTLLIATETGLGGS